MVINNSLIKPNYQLRMNARQQLKGNWGSALLLCLIFNIINLITFNINGIVFAIWILIIGPLTLGLKAGFMNLIQNKTIRLEDIFDGFKNFGSALLLSLLTKLFFLLWTSLFIIPGIIAACSYSMAFYIMNDNPKISAMDAIRLSTEMMDGFKRKLFVLYLSFIGWGILCILSFGIGFLWLSPYVNASLANFYQNLKETYGLNNTKTTEPRFIEC